MPSIVGQTSPVAAAGAPPGRTGAKAILLKSGFMMVLFVVVAMIV